MANVVFTNPQELLTATDKDLGYSQWLTIDQERIDTFAAATGDHQWIHVDPEKAAKGPFGACIAHGYLSMSLVNLFLPQLLKVEKMAMGINYGVNRVRFPAPVIVNSKIRGGGKVMSAEDLGNKTVQATYVVTIEIDKQPKPACVAEVIARYVGE